MVTLLLYEQHSDLGIFFLKKVGQLFLGKSNVSDGNISDGTLRFSPLITVLNNADSISFRVCGV